jgi:hypothetical protein
LGDGLEALLTGGVPDLHSDFFSVDLYGFDFEIDPWVAWWVPIVVR